MSNVAVFNPTQSMTSREIAELTGKRHDNVMADIRKMLQELEVTSPEFSVDLPDTYGRLQPAFALPKRETLILVSGYSTVMRSKIIDRWQELEAKSVQLSPMEMVIASAQAIMKIEKEQAEMKSKLFALEQRVENFNGETGYRTVTAFLSMRKIKKSLSVAKLIGMQCTSLCKELGITVGEVPDERFGKVNSYPIEVLEEILAKDMFNRSTK